MHRSSRTLYLGVVLTLLMTLLAGALPAAAAKPPTPNDNGKRTSPPAGATGVASKPGNVLSWGYNEDGELGNGTYTGGTTVIFPPCFPFGCERGQEVSAQSSENAIPFPTQAIGLGGITAIDAGAYHTLALDGDGAVYAWGDNGNGQLGYGGEDYNDSAFPARVAAPGTIAFPSPSGSPVPTVIPGTVGTYISDVAAVAAGTGHSLALKKDGTVYAWGSNSDGELGIGIRCNQQPATGICYATVPVQVRDTNDPSGYLTGVIAIAAGEYYSMALKADGSVYAWGSNSDGQLGNGDSSPFVNGDDSDRYLPVRVVAPGTAPCAQPDQSVENPAPNTCPAVPFLGGITAIAAATTDDGGPFSMALGPNGTVYTWGYNSTGELGNGDIGSNSRVVPVQVVAPGTVPCIQPDPYAQVPEPNTCPSGPFLTGVTAIDAGGYHALALLANGTVLSWGGNFDGQLGNGDNSNSNNVIKSRVVPVQVVAPGTTPCAQPDGYTLPQPPNTCPSASPLSGITAIAAGSYHSLALKSDGTLLSWGDNYDSQLGNGDLSGNDHVVPTPVITGANSGPLTRVTGITAGGYHSATIAPPPVATFTVTASKTGSGTISNEGVTSYDTGTEASYTATAAAGQTFTGWTLDGQYVGYASPLKFTVTTNRTLVATFVATPTFSDLGGLNADERQAVTFLAALGIVNPGGVNGSGQFQPGADVQRAQVAAFIARTFSWQQEFHANPFPDKCDANGQNCIDDELWNNVAALKDYGVVGGYTDPATCQSAGTTAPCYLPRDVVQRIQVVSVVARSFIKQPDQRPTGFWDRLNADGAQYTNVPDAGTQRSDLTTYRANVGTVPGQTSDTNFNDPNGNGSRLYMVRVLYAAFNAQFGTDRVP